MAFLARIFRNFFEIPSLIPDISDEWNFFPKKEEDMVFLGNATLSRIIEFWEFILRDIDSRSQDLTEQISEIEDEIKITESDVSDSVNKDINDPALRIMQNLEEKKKGLIKERKNVLRKIFMLREFRALAFCKPAIPSFRPSGWFKEEDRVICIIQELKNKVLLSNYAIGSVTCSGGEINFVRVFCDEVVHNSGSNEIDNRTLTVPVMSYKIVHLWEIDYLSKNPDFFKVWANGLSSKDKKLYRSGFMTIR